MPLDTKNEIPFFFCHVGLVAQRITRLTTDQKIAGSNPAEIVFFVNVTSY
jgi:hypothetical protein